MSFPASIFVYAWYLQVFGGRLTCRHHQNSSSAMMRCGHVLCGSLIAENLLPILLFMTVLLFQSEYKTIINNISNGCACKLRVWGTRWSCKSLYQEQNTAASILNVVSFMVWEIWPPTIHQS